MWQKQFNAKPNPNAPLYVIGDVHGRCDLLIRLISMIDADAEARRITNHIIVFVGDYIDRGPESALVLSVLQQLQGDPSRRVLALKGNHEHMLVRFLEDPSKGPRWLKNGGFETLLSYGITGVTEDSPIEDLTEASQKLTKAMGVETIQFLNDLELTFTSGNIFVCHAGGDPTQPLDKQGEKELLWGHPQFKKKTRKDKFWVVHGHYAESTPLIENGRISTDTGAYFSNQLTAARILNDEIKFMTAEL